MGFLLGPRKFPIIKMCVFLLQCFMGPAQILRVLTCSIKPAAYIVLFIIFCTDLCSKH